MDDVFWISITTILVGFFGMSMRMCLRSKCDNVECFCLKIHRNTEQEIDLPDTTNTNMIDIYRNKSNDNIII